MDRRLAPAKANLVLQVTSYGESHILLAYRSRRMKESRGTRGGIIIEQVVDDCSVRSVNHMIGEETDIWPRSICPNGLSLFRGCI